MTNDARLAQLLTECLADLDLNSADGRAGIRAALREIEEISPGEVEAMAARLQMSRLGLRTRH